VGFFILILFLFLEGKEVCYYDVKLGAITLGEIVLKSDLIEEGDRDFFLFEMASKSKGILSRIYPMNDTIISYVDPERFATIKYIKKIHEKDTTFYTTVKFEIDSGIAIYTDGKRYYTPINAMDALSMIFFIRKLSIGEGEKKFIPYHFDKRSSVIPVELIGEEVIKTPLESKETYLIILHQKGRNLFRGKGDIFIWMGKDDRIIYKLAFKTKFGKLYALLKRRETFNGN
jgi:hypothetical protein